MTRPPLMAAALCAALALLLTIERKADAQFNLQITEIWPGNDPGNNLTEDWFEVTNIGSSAWTAATHGDLYWEDVSANPALAVILSGVASIGPNQSAVFVNGGAAGATAWSNLWDDVVTLPLVGFSSGPGLGQGGDTVNLYLDDVLPVGIPTLSLLDSAGYPDAGTTGGRSFDVGLNAFSTVGNASGAVATIVVNDMQQPAIGSPGRPLVPEPTSIVLLLAGIVGVACGRRNRR